MSPETWSCAKCSAAYPPAVAACPVCGLGPGEAAPEPGVKKRTADLPPVEFPLVLDDARFFLPFKQGAVWSMGRIVVTGHGFSLVCTRDKLPIERTYDYSAGGAVRLAENSLFLPASMVKRVTHPTAEGFYLHAQDKKIELRLPGGAWPKVDAACAKLGVEF